MENINLNLDNHKHEHHYCDLNNDQYSENPLLDISVKNSFNCGLPSS